MAISLKDKKAVVKVFVLDLDGEAITGTFRPGIVTFGWSRELQSLGKPKEGGEPAADVDKTLIAKIREVTASWDVEYEPGLPVPLTEDALMDVPTEILTAVLQGVIKAASAGEAKAGSTPAPSVVSFSNEGA